MMKMATRMMMTAAAAGMMIAPIAAHAGTRASDSGSVYSVSASQPGLGRADDGETLASGFSIILGLLAVAATIGGLIFVTDSNDNGQSPGT